MSDFSITIIFGVLVFALFLISVIVYSRLIWLERDNNVNKGEIAMLRKAADNTYYAISMGENVKINSVLWELMDKCGYRINYNLNHFELEKNKGGVESYEKERAETVSSKPKKKES